MAFTALTGLMAGTTAVTAVNVLAAVAQVGMALTVVGGVTGSKSLMKVGAALSLVGGVGGMVAGAASGGAAAAGAAGESAAAGLAEGGADAATSAASSEGAGLGADTLSNATAGQGTGMIGSTMDSAATPTLESAAQTAVAPTQTPSQSLQSELKVAPDRTTTITPSDTAGKGATNPFEDPSSAYATNGSDAMSDAYRGGVGGFTAPESSGNFFGKISKFANENKTLFSAGLQLAGGALKGASEAKMWNEKMGFQREQAAKANSVGNFAPRPATGIIAGARA